MPMRGQWKVLPLYVKGLCRLQAAGPARSAFTLWWSQLEALAGAPQRAQQRDAAQALQQPLRLQPRWPAVRQRCAQGRRARSAIPALISAMNVDVLAAFYLQQRCRLCGAVVAI